MCVLCALDMHEFYDESQKELQALGVEDYRIKLFLMHRPVNENGIRVDTWTISDGSQVILPHCRLDTKAL